MVFKNLSVLVPRTIMVSAMEGLKAEVLSKSNQKTI